MIDFEEESVSLDLCIPLCRFQSAIECLIEDFCTHSSLYSRQSASSQNPGASLTNRKMDDWDPLSETELIRLQRGFYRYNTCQNLMRAIRPYKIDTECVYGQLAEFLSAFSPWEVEEIGCVHDFITKRLYQITENLEDEFVQSVVHADLKIRQDENLANQAFESIDARLNCMSRILHPEALDDHYRLGLSQSLFDEVGPDAYFSIKGKEYQEFQIRALASLGTPFLRKFLESNTKNKIHLISKHGDTWAYDLHDALENSFPRGRLFNIEQNQELYTELTTVEGESVSRPNKAWVWANAGSATSCFYQPHDYDLRVVGYVFWDSGRLQKMNFMQQERVAQERSSALVSSSTRRKKSPSAEQRLRDMGLIVSIHERS